MRLLKILITASALVLTSVGSFALRDAQPTPAPAALASLDISGPAMAAGQQLWDMLAASPSQDSLAQPTP
jgi:hypothetical protein